MAELVAAVAAHAEAEATKAEAEAAEAAKAAEEVKAAEEGKAAEEAAEANRFPNGIYERQCRIIIGIMRENARQQNWTVEQIEEAEKKILQANTERKYPMFEPNKYQRNI